MNKVQLLGNVGKVLFDNQADTQKRFISISLATSEKWKDSANNEVVKTSWHKLTVFGPMAESMVKNVKVGSRMFIEGELRYQEYEDKNGNKQYSTDILVRNFLIGC